MKNRRRLVYTALIGQYEEFQDLPLKVREGTDLVCFADGELASKNWSVRNVSPRFPHDTVRSARYLKIMGPNLFGDYAESLWIDNSVALKATPDEILDEFLDGAQLGLMHHSYRATVAAEFDAVNSIGVDDPFRVYEQLFHYASENPEILEDKPLWTGLMARKHTQEVKDAMACWWDHVLRYSRRDQLSFNHAMNFVSLKPKIYKLDNKSSVFHEWPKVKNRKTAISKGSTVLEALRSAPASKVAALENKIGELNESLSASKSINAKLKGEVQKPYSKFANAELMLATLRKRVPSDLFQQVLSHMLTERKIRLVQIGVCDGVINDPIYETVMKHPHRSKLLLVEPQEFLAPVIAGNYATHPDFKISSCAVGKSGKLILFRLKKEYHDRILRTYLKDSPAYRVPAGFVSSDRAHVLKHAAPLLTDVENVQDAIEQFEVPSKNLKEVLDDAGWDGLDVLQIDAEGCDDEVLQNCNLSIFRPAIVHFEHIHLAQDKLKSIFSYLEKIGYLLWPYSASDTLASRFRLSLN